MAFHIPLASPPDLTVHLVELLAAESGVTHVVVLPGSARRGGPAARRGSRSMRHYDAVQLPATTQVRSR